jgi:16S rRNA (cytosine1402-N4)-methyltransferase
MPVGVQVQVLFPVVDILLLLSMTIAQSHYHVPVLVDAVLQFMPVWCQYIVDGTLGHGGHTLHMIQSLHTDDNLHVYGFDRDQDMITKAQHQLQQHTDYITIFHDTYQNIPKYINDHMIPVPDLVLLDLWVNNDHFIQKERGFSLQYDGPLDMRFDRNQSLTAQQIVHTYSAKQLSDIFVLYGEFTPHQIQKCVDTIIRMRSVQSIDTTFKLKNICLSSHIPFHKIAALFQALRIEVNQEMKHLQVFLEHLVACLKVWSRVMIITYHSIEDRIVKHAFLQYTQQHKAILVNKKVIKPTYQEQQSNKKSRSAKLRIIEII